MVLLTVTVPAVDGSLTGNDSDDFDPAELREAAFPGEEFDARLEARFARLSAKVG